MKINIDKLFVYKHFTIREVLNVLDSGARGIVFLVDDNKKLVGTITDGDIRRAILNGLSLDGTIEKIAHVNPVCAFKNVSKDEIKDIFIKEAVKDIPIVDENNIIIDLISIKDILIPQGKENYVIIMAGGLGTRLKELTQEIPKPMLKVGKDPMLQHIINNFKRHWYNKVLISVNYKSEIIENYFQDGYVHGVKIEYLREHKRLGTAGGIKLASEYIDKPFFVINGDIFTNFNAENMMDFHKTNGFDITVGTRKHHFQIPYGVIKTNGIDIEGIDEKPSIEYSINAGIYCLNPSIIDFIPKDQYFEITDLINKCINSNKRVGFYEIKEYWMDIGQLEDYNKLNEDILNL
jgi:dTDP-glucose pyrophosphorylase